MMLPETTMPTGSTMPVEPLERLLEGHPVPLLQLRFSAIGIDRS